MPKTTKSFDLTRYRVMPRDQQIEWATKASQADYLNMRSEIAAALHVVEKEETEDETKQILELAMLLGRLEIGRKKG